MEENLIYFSSLDSLVSILGILVAALVGLVTLLIGWQIYNWLSFESRMKKYSRKLHEDSKREIITNTETIQKALEEEISKHFVVSWMVNMMETEKLEHKLGNLTMALNQLPKCPLKMQKNQYNIMLKHLREQNLGISRAFYEKMMPCVKRLNSTIDTTDLLIYLKENLIEDTDGEKKG